MAHGFKKIGFKVVAGIDADPSCKVPFEENNDGVFVGEDIKKVTAAQLRKYWGAAPVRILVGCAPCQPFSKYNQGGGPNGKWFLLKQFARLVKETDPDIVSMENVKELLTFKRSRIYRDFTDDLEVWERVAAHGKAAGLEWAGDWENMREMAHFQHTGGLTMAEIRAGGVVA